MRKTGILFAVIGAAASVGLLLVAGRSTPPVLLVLFIGWVALPFVFLVVCNWYYAHLPLTTMSRTTLAVTVLVTVCSVAIYATSLRGRSLLLRQERGSSYPRFRS